MVWRGAGDWMLVSGVEIGFVVGLGWWVRRSVDRQGMGWDGVMGWDG